MASSNRQTLVNLSVFAGSAALFAAAWTGVVAADRLEQDLMVAALPVGEPAVSAAVVPAMVSASVQPGTTVQTQPAPAATPRRVVVVRQSRAS
ncbi:MAG: hypothetical protein AB7F65_09870 [Dehalococcoidia bacterium]